MGLSTARIHWRFGATWGRYPQNRTTLLPWRRRKKVLPICW